MTTEDDRETQQAEQDGPGSNRLTSTPRAELQIAAAPVGSLAWYRQGGPRLRVGQTCGLLADAGLATIQDIFARLTRPFRKTPPHVDLTVPALNETAASRAARLWARKNLSKDVYDHSERTLLFATVEWLLSGGPEGRWGDLDLEVLRLAGLFHDSTLHEPAVEAHGCFSVGSADLAAKFAKEQGLSADAIEQIVIAITANPSPRTSQDVHGTAAVVLSVGGMDEMLSRLYRMNPRNTDEIARAHPWNGFTVQVRDHMKYQRQQYPGSRFAYTGPLLNLMMRLSARNRG